VGVIDRSPASSHSRRVTRWATLDLNKRTISAGASAAHYSRIAVTESRRRGAERLTILADPYAAGFYDRNGAVPIA
jgi:hypothetical protein